MANKAPEIIITSIVIVTVTFLYITNKFLSSTSLVQQPQKEYNWLVHCLLNVLGYSTVFLPGYLVFKYTRKINYLGKSNRLFTSAISKCFGEVELIGTAHQPVVPPERTQFQECLLLLFYFVGLQVSYLSWGVLQEKVMTQPYRNDSSQGYFKDSQFLVFVNRILAFSMTGAILVCRRQPRHRCPLYKYSFCSFSNIMSSWCQYEALKYVSFPHQVLAKAAKVIPVMVMGKIVSKAKYEYYEYVTAVMLSFGMLLFMLDTGNDRSTSTITTFSGVILLISYVVFDSFTSNWQGQLFKTYSMKPVQMMCCVNLFSCIFTFVSLLQQGTLAESVTFMIQFPKFMVDCVLLSVFSAAGQLFIYSTLSTFGPLIFAIITTVRQGFSVLLSCIIYHHHVDFFGIAGVILVFVSILLRSYCSHRLKIIRSKNQNVA